MLSEFGLDKQLEIQKTCLQSADVGLWFWNVKNNNVVFSKTWKSMIGYKENELKNHLDTWSDNVHPEDVDGAMETLTGYLKNWRTMECYKHIHRLKHKKGHYIHIIDTGKVCQLDENGEPEIAGGVHINITERVVAEQKVLELVKSKQRMLAITSHELRTPLTGLIGAIELLHDTRLNKKQKDLVDILKTSSSYLLAIINDILDYSKLQEQKLILEYIPVNLVELFSLVESIYLSSAKSKNVNLIMIYKKMPYPNVITDPTRCMQILNNIISNSIKFTPKGGKIICSVAQEKQKDCVILTRVVIQDTGIGMTEDQLKKLFNPFEQADSSTTRQYKGTGLGMSIVKNLVDKLDGTIDVSSKIRKGTTTMINLYLMESDKESKIEDNRVNYKKKCIFAEDNLINTKVGVQLLSNFGITSYVVSNGEEALTAIKEGIDHDILFTDIRMPVMDGVTLMEKLGKDYQKPIVCITANYSEEDIKLYKSVGANYVIKKPININELKQILNIIFG